MTSLRYLVAALAVLIAGCAATPTSPAPEARPQAAQVEPGQPGSRKINRNLSGYSLAFKQGFVEGCESAEYGNQRRNESRYKSDIDYSIGWNDGFSACRR